MIHSYKNVVGKTFDFVVSTVPFDGLMLLGARTFARSAMSILRLINRENCYFEGSQFIDDIDSWSKQQPCLPLKQDVSTFFHSENKSNLTKQIVVLSNQLKSNIYIYNMFSFKQH